MPSRTASKYGSFVRFMQQMMVLVAVLVIWEIGVASGWLQAFIVGRPATVGEELLKIAVSGHTWAAARVTFWEVALGLTLGGLAGIVAAAALNSVRYLRLAFDPLILGFYSLPRLALVPLLLVWFGLGMASKVAVVFVHGFVLLLLGTHAAIDNVDRNLLANLKLMGARRGTMIRMIYIPSAAPFLFTALRQAIGLGVGSAIIAELIGANAGLGFEMNLRLTRFDMAGTIAWIIFAALLAVTLDTLSARVEQSVLRWR